MHLVIFYIVVVDIRTWICNHMDSFYENQLFAIAFTYNGGLAKPLLKLGMDE